MTRRQRGGMEGKKTKSRKAKKTTKDRKSKVIINLNSYNNENGNELVEGEPEQDAE